MERPSIQMRPDFIFGRMTPLGFVAACPGCSEKIVVLLPGGLEATREALSMEGGWPRVCDTCKANFAIKLQSD